MYSLEKKRHKKPNGAQLLPVHVQSYLPFITTHNHLHHTQQQQSGQASLGTVTERVHLVTG